MKIPRLVVVTWNDAWTPGSDEKIKHQPFVQYSAGFLLRSDKTGVTLAACVDEEGGTDRGLFIPRGVVLRVQRVK